MNYRRLRTAVWIFLALAFTALLPGLGFLSCEETLEVCPSCGEIADGNDEIVGDARIDMTFTAVQKLRGIVDGMDRRRRQSATALAHSFGVPVNENGPDMDALLNAVQEFFSQPSVSSFSASVFFGACSVDRDAGNRAQNMCEDRLCKIDNPSESGLCRGLSVGPCTTVAEGTCFTSSTDACEGEASCVGVCAEMDAGDCPGDCAGNCDGNCPAYAEDGRCNSHCNGLCSGNCEAPLPTSCNGTCNGACGVAQTLGSCDDTDTFSGICNDVSNLVACRGQYYPEGCGTCSECSTTSRDCREISKFTAWMGLTCTSSEVRVSSTASDASGQAPSILQRTKALERALTPIAHDFNRLSLLLNGIDLRTGEDLGPSFENGEDSMLDDASSQYFDYKDMDPEAQPPVDLTRSYLPIESLKARVYWLRRVSMNSSGNFRVSAGTFDCLSPALEDVATILSAMVPVTRSQSSGEVVDSAFTACEPYTDTSMGSIPCLYNLYQRQSDLLRLLKIEPGQ